MALPLPKVIADVGPGGPLITSMQGMNALTKSNLENQQNALINQFLPAEIQAKIRQQTSPMSLYGPNAGVLSYLNALKTGQVPQPQDLSASAGNALNTNGFAKILGNNFISQLLGGGVGSLLGPGNNANNGNNINSPSPNSGAANNNAMTSGPFGASDTTSQPGDMGANNLATPAEVDRAGGGSSSNAINTDYNDPNSPAYQYAHPLEYQAAVTSKTHAAQNEQENLNNIQKEAQSYQNTAPRIESDANRIQDALNHVKNWAIGPRGERIPEWATPQETATYLQQMDNARKDLATILAPAINNGHLAVKNLDIAKTLKGDRSLTRESATELLNFSKAWANRSQKYLPLSQQLLKKGAKSAEIVNAFNSLNNHDPFYDVVNKKENANNDEWKNYSTPEALEQIRNNGEANPYVTHARFRIPGETRLLRVPQNRIKEFMKDHPNAKRV